MNKYKIIKMFDSKKQQSFSSYSQQKNNSPQMSQDDKFSQYDQNIKVNGCQQQKNNKEKKAYIERRRYSYGKIQQKIPNYKYSTSFDQVNNTMPSHYSINNLNNLKQCRYVRGFNSPSGIGSFESSLLEQYDKLYLNGYSKYYKNRNQSSKISKLQTSSAISNSFDNNSLNRSQYWNGQKFSYLTQKQVQQKTLNALKQKVNINENKYLQRNTASGLIINKKNVKQNKQFQLSRQKSKNLTQEYIKIEEDFSNSKGLSQGKNKIGQNYSKKKLQPNSYVKNQHQPQIIKQKNKKELNSSQFNSIKIITRQQKLRANQYEMLVSQKNNLIIENNMLKDKLNRKALQIQRISKQRISDNQQYSKTIQKLKTLFQSEKVSIKKQFQEEINIYKSVRKQALKNQLVKDQEERLKLIIQKNKIQNQFKKVTHQLNHLKQQLINKTAKINVLQQKLSLFESKKVKNEQIKVKEIQSNNKNTQQNVQYKLTNNKQKDKLEIKNDQKQEKRLLPQWKNNFINVFKNMVIKLMGQNCKNLSEKKIVTIGWKVMKIMVQKGVKLGIKIPQFINDEKLGQVSIISYPCSNQNELKKYHLTNNKKPLRN